MKIFKYISIILIALTLGFTPLAYADTVTGFGELGGQGASIFSIEFYTDSKVLYSTTLPFTIDPTRSFCYPVGRVEGDGKSDTGVICRVNVDGITNWYLQLSGVASSSPAFPMGNFFFYLGQPWNRNISQQANGTLRYSPNWTAIPTSPTWVYMSGTNDTVNTDLGTLATFSFAINPINLYGGQSYTVTITYTLTTTA